MFLGKMFLKYAANLQENTHAEVTILIKFQNNLVEVALWHGCCRVSLLYIFRTPFPKSTSRQLLLKRHFLSGGMCYLCFPNRAGTKWAEEGPACDIEYAFRNITNY